MRRDNYQIRIDPVARDRLKVLLPDNLTIGYPLEMFAALYPRTIDRFKAVFSSAEINLMQEACISLSLTPTLAGQHLRLLISKGCIFKHLAEKWRCEMLLRKIDRLTIWEAACLEIELQK